MWIPNMAAWSFAARRRIITRVRIYEPNITRKRMFKAVGANVVSLRGWYGGIKTGRDFKAG